MNEWYSLIWYRTQAISKGMEYTTGSSYRKPLHMSEDFNEPMEEFREYME